MRVNDEVWAAEQVLPFLKTAIVNEKPAILRGLPVKIDGGITFRMHAFLEYLSLEAEDRENRVVTEQLAWRILGEAGCVKYRIRVGYRTLNVWRFTIGEMK